MAFATYFTVMGTVLAWFHKLDPNFVALVTAIQMLVTARSVANDKYPPDGKGGTT